MNEHFKKIIQYSKDNDLTPEMTSLLLIICLEDVLLLRLNGNGWFDDDTILNEFFNGDEDRTKHPSYAHWIKIFPNYGRLSNEEREKQTQELIDKYGG